MAKRSPLGACFVIVALGGRQSARRQSAIGKKGGRMENDKTRTNGAPRRTGAEETVEPGVAHVEIDPGAPTETAGAGSLQVDDETGRRPSGAGTNRPAPGS